MQQTSIKAYHEILDQLPRMRAAVYDAYMECRSDKGAPPTAGELQAFMFSRAEFRGSAAGCWKRLSELADLHFLIRRGPPRECTVTGKSAIQWMLPKSKEQQMEFDFGCKDGS